jgi:hypothetical protein
MPQLARVRVRNRRRQRDHRRHRGTAELYAIRHGQRTNALARQALEVGSHLAQRVLAVDEDAAWTLSDHCPVVLEIDEM